MSDTEPRLLPQNSDTFSGGRPAESCISATDEKAAGSGPAQTVDRRSRHGIALCLSGGGFRASIFHVGALRRLDELGVLGKVDAISCVSGGSIIGGFLASALSSGRLKLNELGRYTGLSEALEDFLKFTRRDIRTFPALSRLNPFGRTGKAPRAIQSYYEELVGDIPLTSLPDRPRFIFCATNLFYANSWICEKQRVGDYLAGYATPPPKEWTIARGIAVSSCFPPVFDPAEIGLPRGSLKQGKAEADCSDQIRLTDGGVYDNLGLEPVWKRYATILVSDGGKPLQYKYVPSGTRLLRYQEVIQNQVLALRKRWLIDTFQRAKLGRGVDEDTFNGTYWGIMGSTSRYVEENAARKPADRVDLTDFGYSSQLANVIANIRTDLNPFSPDEIAVLTKHGYELADIALASHLPGSAPLQTPRCHWPKKLANEALVTKALASSASRFWSTFTPNARSLLT